MEKSDLKIDELHQSKKCVERKKFFHYFFIFTSLSALTFLSVSLFIRLSLLEDQVLIIRQELEDVKYKLRIETSHVRHRRDAEAEPESDADGVPVVYDFAYGVDLNKKDSLRVYPTLQGKGGKKGRQQQQQQQQHRQSVENYSNEISSTPGSGHHQDNNFNYHYLGIMRHVSAEDNYAAPTQPPAQPQPQPQYLQRQATATTSSAARNASAYGKRLHTFRHSRVSMTAAEEANLQTTTTTRSPPPNLMQESREELPFQAAKPEIVSFKRPQVKSLDVDDSTDSLAIHFQAKVSVADESSSHLVTGLHDSWRVSQMSKQVKGFSLFKLDESLGQVTIPQTGFYLVYTQVEYMDSHEINGYEVYLNNEPFISCVTSSHGAKEKKKHNTCFTSAVVFIEQGGVLHVRDKEAGRYSLLHSTGTFFGVAKISAA